MSGKKWIILAIALCVAWVLVSGVRQHNEDVIRATDFADFAYKTCISAPANSGIFGVQACQRERENNLVTWMEHDYESVAFIALAPIPVGWLAGYILLMLWRILVAGFRVIFPWPSLTRSRKFVVYGSGAAVVAACLMFALTILNLYAETRVPVGSGTSVSVFDEGETVYTEATWTRHGNSPDSEMGYPLQISRIVCTRSEQKCTEARAMVAEPGRSRSKHTSLP